MVYITTCMTFQIIIYYLVSENIPLIYYISLDRNKCSFMTASPWVFVFTLIPNVPASRRSSKWQIWDINNWMLIIQNIYKTVNMCSAVNYIILINDTYLYKVKVSLYFLSIVPWNTLLLRRIINVTGKLFQNFFFTVQWNGYPWTYAFNWYIMHSEYTS